MLASAAAAQFLIHLKLSCHPGGEVYQLLFCFGRIRPEGIEPEFPF
jgi:hypothetical protein